MMRVQQVAHRQTPATTMSESEPEEQTRAVYQVSEIVNQVRFVLEEEFGMLWIEGEVSNISLSIFK